MIVLLLFALLLFLPASIASAAGGSNPGVSHLNCATSEPTINSAATTFLCDDFELNGAGGTPGEWYGVHCDGAGTGGSGEDAIESKGWCGQIFSIPTCHDVDGCAVYGSGQGANGTLGAARSIVNTSNAHAAHSFQSTCPSGALNPSIISGVCHVDEVYVRFLVKFGTDHVFGQNQKLVTINPHGNGTGGIILGGPLGLPDARADLPACPIHDCGILNFDNPQDTDGSGDGYLGQNAGNGVLRVDGARLGRWTAIEFRMRLNPANVQSGLFDLWMDDCGTDGTTCPATQTLRSTYNNIRWRGTNAVAGNETGKIGMLFLDTWTNTNSGTILIDQVVVSTEPIGWSASGGGTQRFATSVARGATGTTCSVGSPCTVTTCLAQSSAGDTCTLEGNTAASPYPYTHADDMIDPPNTLSGASGSPITVRCGVPGGCEINAGFVSGRFPVRLESGNSWWVLEDFDVKNANTQAVSINGSENIVRRVVGYDSNFHSSNAEGFACHGGTNNLFEDVAFFGVGGWHFTHSQNKTGSCTFRRAWGRFEGTATGSNNGTAFGGLFYNALQSTCENCLSEYRPNTNQTSFRVHTVTATSNIGCPGGVCTDGAPPWPGGALNINRWDGTEPSGGFDGQILGSIGYVRQGANLARQTLGAVNPALIFGSNLRTGGGITFKDVLLFFDPNHADFADTRAFHLLPRDTTEALALTDVSTVAGNANSIDAQWTTTDVVHTTSLAGLNNANADPWEGTQGANLCHKYVNRVRTTEPLWPWPMNDRIKAATARAGAYSGPCFHGSDTDENGSPACATFPTRTETDVTAQIEALLGAIPAQCLTTTGGGGGFSTCPTCPGGSVLSDFEGGDVAADWATVSGGGLNEAGGVVSSASGFTNARYDSPFENDQRVWARIGTVTDGSTEMFVQARMTDVNNRLRISVASVLGANNDTFTVGDRIAGVNTPVIGPINLGVDLATDDILGAVITGSGVSGFFCDESDSATCYTIGTGTTALAPGGASYIGVGLGSGTFKEFGGEGTAFGGGNNAPSQPLNCSLTPLSQTEQLFKCDESSDDVGVTGYIDKLCSGAACTPTAEIRTSLATSFIISGLTAGTLYRATREATDGALLSTPSTVAEGSTLTNPDTNPPTAPTVPQVSRVGQSVGNEPRINAVRIRVTPGTDSETVVDATRWEQGDANCANFVEIAPTGPVSEYLDVTLGAPLTEARCYRARHADYAGNLGDYSPNVLLPPVSGGRVR